MVRFELAAITSAIAASRRDIRVMISNIYIVLTNDGEVLASHSSKRDAGFHTGELLAYPGVDAQHTRTSGCLAISRPRSQTKTGGRAP